MSDVKTPRILFCTILFAGLAFGLHDFPQLPDRLASHFGASGMPNGWMPKTGFFFVYLIVILAACSVEFLLPRSIAKRPDRRINLPHKEYWLAPERRAETFAFFEKFFAWYGCAFLLLEVCVLELALQANFRNPPVLPTGPVVTLIVAFVLFNIGGVITIFRRFSQTT